MTNLIEFRRQREIKKRMEELEEQQDKQNKALSHLRTLFTTHEHEKYVVKTELPAPYVHPKTGMCPQKPQPHGHVAKDITDLKIPEPYTFEDLKRDHPKLTEPYLHEPKKHTHPANEIIGKIPAEHIETKGLDADLVDGKHAKDLIAEVAKKVRRVYVGGGGEGVGDGDAKKIQGKTIDISGRADDTILVFKSITDSYQHEPKGAPGAHAATHETGGSDKVHFADLEHDEADATLHDNFTSAPHISQAEKDRIHERLHALSSVSDHSGEITDAQHGTRGANLHSDSHAKLHKNSHKVGGEDAFTSTDLLEAVAKTTVRKNSGADVGSRRRLNLIEGTNVSLTVADDPANEEIDITIASGGGGGGVPSDTVQSETSFGQPPNAGVSTEYSRGDHTHGTPPDPHAMIWALILG